MTRLSDGPLQHRDHALVCTCDSCQIARWAYAVLNAEPQPRNTWPPQWTRRTR